MAEPPTTDWIALLSTPLPLAEAIAFVQGPAAGGIAIFLGITRQETNAAGHGLTALDYQAYDAMALEQMPGLAQRARERWPVVKLALLHRTGRVALGDPSVLIAVACPHRAEAFDACRWLIDTLKAEVAIWKKELWFDGSATWSGRPSDTPPRPHRL